MNRSIVKPPYIAEFYVLQIFPKGLIHAHVEGSKEENKAKNRFLTTWPCKCKIYLQSFI